MTKKTLPQRRQRSNTADELVRQLEGEITAQSCVVFVGGGATTEKQNSTFFSRISHLSGLADPSQSPSFPELMEYFCDHHDGGQHNRLIREAIHYLEHYSLPGEDNFFATRFPKALAEIPFFRVIVTTNWDPFLERSLSVLVPMVEDRDLAFWDDAKKQVLKIHGCVTRPHSLVATEGDYEKSTRSNPLIFNKLRDLLATKTFLFVGYSLKDKDFRKVWESITKKLRRFAKLAYAIDPHAGDADVSYWRQRGIRIVQTYDMDFMGALRTRLERLKLIPSERILNFLAGEKRRIARLHGKMKQTSDGAFASAMYQDGLMHAMEDTLDSARLGTSKREDFEAEFHHAVETVQKMVRQKNIIEVAYWSGRREAMRTFCSESFSPVPEYFHPYSGKPIRKFVRGEAWTEKTFPKRPALSKSRARSAMDKIRNVILVCPECHRLSTMRRESRHS